MFIRTFLEMFRALDTSTEKLFVQVIEESRKAKMLGSIFQSDPGPLKQ